MTNNQQLMSILIDVGESKQLKDLSIILVCLLGVAVITTVVLVPKYCEAFGENK